MLFLVGQVSFLSLFFLTFYWSFVDFTSCIPIPASHSLFYTQQVKNSPFLAFGHQKGKEKKKVREWNWKSLQRAREVAQQLTVLAALPEDAGLILSNHMVAHNCCNSSFRELTPSRGHTSRQNTNKHKTNFLKKSLHKKQERFAISGAMDIKTTAHFFIWSYYREQQ